jgi:hypothetical protein
VKTGWDDVDAGKGHHRDHGIASGACQAKRPQSADSEMWPLRIMTQIVQVIQALRILTLHRV